MLGGRHCRRRSAPDQGRNASPASRTLELSTTDRGSTARWRPIAVACAAVLNASEAPSRCPFRQWHSYVRGTTGGTAYTSWLRETVDVSETSQAGPSDHRRAGTRPHARARLVTDPQRVGTAHATLLVLWHTASPAAPRYRHWDQWTRPRHAALNALLLWFLVPLLVLATAGVRTVLVLKADARLVVARSAAAPRAVARAFCPHRCHPQRPTSCLRSGAPAAAPFAR